MFKKFKSTSMAVVKAAKASQNNKNDWISKRKNILDRHKAAGLKLAINFTDNPGNYEFREDKYQKVTIKDRKGKNLSLSETLPPYEKYSDEDIDQIERGTTYWDPLFNPHLYDERNRVNPDEAPFNAIYQGNEETEGADEYTDVRVVTTPKLWEFVEGLKRIKRAPYVKPRKIGEPITRMPSGFVAPPEQAPDLPYFVPRTRNLLLPVYYLLSKDPEESRTYIRYIQGDMWTFEKDLRTHLESLKPDMGRILSFVREPDECVGFRGRHIHEVVDWLYNQGF